MTLVIKYHVMYLPATDRSHGGKIAKNSSHFMSEWGHILILAPLLMRDYSQQLDFIICITQLFIEIKILL